LGYKDIEIRKSEFVAKTQFLYTICPGLIHIPSLGSGQIIGYIVPLFSRLLNTNIKQTNKISVLLIHIVFFITVLPKAKKKAKFIFN